MPVPGNLSAVAVVRASTLVLVVALAGVVAAPANPAAIAAPSPTPSATQPSGAQPSGAQPGASPTASSTASPGEVYIEVDPSTVEAGSRVRLRASCPDNSKPATVRSDAFGRVQVLPAAGVLSYRVTIPSDQAPRSFTVRLTCPGGQTASATLHVVARTRPSQGPATGFGGTAGGGPGLLLVGVGLLAIAAGGGLGLLAVRRRRVLG